MGSLTLLLCVLVCCERHVRLMETSNDKMDWMSNNGAQQRWQMSTGYQQSNVDHVYGQVTFSLALMTATYPSFTALLSAGLPRK